MLLAGDERSHSAQGNNNCYSQDNFLSWLTWDFKPFQKRQLDFVRRLIEIRKEQPALSRRRFFQSSVQGDDVDDIYWLDSSGHRMSEAAWKDNSLRSLGMLLLGHCSQIDDQGACIIGDNLLVLMNAGETAVPFTMPRAVKRFRLIDRLFDTYDGEIDVVHYDTSVPYVLQPKSMALFRHKIGR